MSALELPSRRGCQSLDGYVREHLERLEQELSTGVRYGALVDAAQAAGFSKVAVRSLHSAMHRARKRRAKRSPAPTRQPVGSSWPSRTGDEKHPVSSPEDDTVLLARRFRQLVRPPGPGTDERDALI
jgi:hypothetical protein